jgi:ATP-dependent DNA helicase DinG
MEVSDRNPLQVDGKNGILPPQLPILQSQSPSSPCLPLSMISINEEFPPLSSPPQGEFAREIAEIFGPKGSLSAISGFEWRPEQQRMAASVAEALERRTHLVVEAGTGVGKSLAYLLPSVLHARRTGRKALISTHTINLQEQLLYKDIPLVRGLLAEEFEAVLLKGRQNYVCPTRLSRAAHHGGDLFTAEERPELERIREWAATTSDGSLSDLPFEPNPQLWAQICSEQHLCTPKTCGRDSGCFYQSARRRAQSAQVLVLNHTLFFTLLGDPDDEGLGYLFPDDFVIFDEAHTVEQVASRHLGFSLSQYGLRQSIQRLYNPRTRKGLLQQARHTEAISTAADLLPEIDRFFDSLAGACTFKQGRECRIREDQSAVLAEAVANSTLSQGLARLAESAGSAASKTEEEGLKGELTEVTSRLRTARAGLNDFLSQNEPGHVYWVERGGKSSTWHSLHAAPVAVAPLLGRLLFRDGGTAVMTSATLSVGSEELGYFKGRVGGEEVPSLQLGSPFDYQRQMKLHLVRKMPEPRDAGYEEALAKWIEHFTTESKARAFVLFTSYKTMQAVAARMEGFFTKKKWNLIIQGGGLSRSRMLETFREESGSVLFGTDSFWTGVDLPGEALSSVIITRLPFITPDHPLTEAKLEEIESSGGDPFRDYSLPEAILKLRQGIGRLIRSGSDTGSIVILDSRILSKYYGKAFLRALPECPVEIL